MKFIKEIEHLEGVKVLVRVDFNVPIKNGIVTEDLRIRSALGTIDFLTSKGAKVILISHIEVLDGEDNSLKPIAERLIDLGEKVDFIPNIREAYDFIENHMKNGECILLENLRKFDGEKTNEEKFAKELASLGDIFVNEAFPACHREHASIVSVPKYLPSYAGLQLEKEIANLSLAFNPAHPFLFILGGAKFETKLSLLERFITVADKIFIGGALANDFFKAKGYEIGHSVVSKGNFDLSPFIGNTKIMIPTDVMTEKGEYKALDGLDKDDKIVDIGPKTLALLEAEVNIAKFVLWNGPLGIYEKGFDGPSIELAKTMANLSSSGATSIVGGGDTIATIESQNIQDKFTFLSTGGGAMLEFLAKGSLPGIDALNNSDK
ncbi:MAG: phosphoglycerate kinase [Candidatus Paceibacterota bacterium]|jgi:3-phosphoglycerate kinase